jgi:HD-GYP domain-containing protein (c-di-GMP phosphodiesterase class II)
MRVLAVADVYEALTAERPYREALGHETAMGILGRDALDGDAVAGLEAFVVAPRFVAPLRVELRH